MSSTPIPRSSIHASQHPVVDSQLKSLKLVTRRLSVAKILEAEVLILQRLFYKNKNQHRSALFWRNVSEIRRYSQRVVSLRLLDNLQSLRVMFHGSATTPISGTQVPTQISTRGSWTCFPSTEYFLNISAQLDLALKLTERMSEACSRAYISFNRSLQSGAFLSLLLTFVAISSRLKTISLELKDICDQSASCISTFLVVHEKTVLKMTSADVAVEGIPPTLDPTFADNVDINIPGVVESPAFNPVTSQAVEFTETQELRATVIFGRKTPQEIKERETIQPIHPRKKKRKVTRNEIDDIFGS